MDKIFVGCSILKEEITAVLNELNIDTEIEYIDAALHVDLDLFEAAFSDKLQSLHKLKLSPKPLVILGNKCHPHLHALAEKFHAKFTEDNNCIELILGEEMQKIDAEAKTFFVTSGWLRRWKDIFIKGIGWDSIDARQNFGSYDRILLINTGIGELKDEDVLEFFEYTQKPIEIYNTDLEHLKKVILNLTQD